ncbi:MAG: hypothetical protein ABIJ03_02380 [Patescibacteria group bacterium]
MFKINLPFKLSKMMLLVICLLALIVGRSYFHAGLPQTHDGNNHLARFANYKIAFKEGQIPPRLAPNLMNHYTYPVFNYNYPLANLLSLPFSALKIPYETTFKLIALAFLFLGGVGVVRLIESVFAYQKLLKQKNQALSQWSIIFGLGIYYSAVYLSNLILIRGNIGEIMAYGLWPWMLTSVLSQPKFNLSNICLWTSWWLVHNIMAVFGWPILILVAILKHGRQLIVWKKFLALGLVSLLLSLWFWLPALAELNLVSAGHSQIVSDAPKHLLSLGQVFFGTTQFGFSRVGGVDDLSFSLGTIQVVVLVLSLAGLINLTFAKLKGLSSSRQTNSKCPKTAIAWQILLALCIALIFVQLTTSQHLWSLIKPWQLIQFPWRLSFFIPPFVVILAVFVWQAINSKWLKMFLVLVLIYQLLGIVNFKPESIVHQPNSYWDAFPESSTTSNEDKPLGFKYLLIADWQPAPFITGGEGQATIRFWNGTRHSYQLGLVTDATIIEPVMMFAGWQTRVNGQLIEHVDSDDIQGRLAFKLPSGEYQVETRFTQQTPARITGNTISLLTALGVLIYLTFKTDATFSS